MEECENNCRFRQSHGFLCSAGVNTCIPVYDFPRCSYSDLIFHRMVRSLDLNIV